MSATTPHPESLSLSLTIYQWELLRQLVSREAIAEAARAIRMADRPKGTHSAQAIRAARQSAADHEAIAKAVDTALLSEVLP